MHIHLHSQDGAPVVSANQSSPENILFARIVTDLMSWIDSGWIIGIIRCGDSVDVFGVYGGSRDPAMWSGYIDSIAICARAMPPASIDSQLRHRDRARVLLPIATDGKMVAVLAIGPRNGNRNEQYSASDMQVLRESGAQLGSLLRAQAAAARADEDFGIVRGIQDRLVPYSCYGLSHSSAPHISGIECSAQCERSGVPGGDFFDLSESSGAGLMATIGNVPIAGSAGCVLMTGLQACLRGLGRRGVELPDLFGELNRMFWEIAPENAYATLFCGRVNPARRQLNYVNAGHQTALIVRRNDHVDRLEPNAPVLGLGRKSAYAQKTVHFGPGDTLIALSEGITQSAAAGEEAIIRMVQDDNGLRVREIPARIIDMVQSLGWLEVDRTAVVVHFRDAASQSLPVVQHAMAAA